MQLATSKGFYVQNRSRYICNQIKADNYAVMGGSRHMIAHIRESDGKEQSLQEHLKNVERLCTRSAEALGLSHLAGLIARLHDMGKANHSFAAYLRACFHNSKSSVKHPTHAATGAIYAWERWGKVASRPQERLTAQIVALTIQGHHAGLPDCLSATGSVPFQTHQKDENSQPEVKSSQEWFIQNITSADELDRLFGLACQEVETFCRLMHTKSCAFEYCTTSSCRIWNSWGRRIHGITTISSAG